MGSPQPDGEGELEGEEEEGEMSWLERARARTAEVLQERKKMKRRLGLAAQKFNSGSKGWLQYAQVRFGGARAARIILSPLLFVERHFILVR